MRRILVTGLITASLAACGGGAPPDGSIHLATREKSSWVAQLFMRPVEIPASAVITQALAYTAADLAKFGMIVRIGGAQGESLLTPDNLEAMTQVVIAQANSTSPPPASFVAKFPELAPRLKGEGAKEIVRALITGQIAAASTLPLAGWEITPLDAAFDNKKCEMGEFFSRGLDCAAVKQRLIDDYHKSLRYTYAIEHTAFVANALYERIARSIDAPVRSEADARAAILEALLAIPPAETQALWDSYQEPTDTKLDMSGKDGIAWISSNGQFHVSAQGIVWSKNGTTWYGEGRVSGRALTLKASTDFARAGGYVAAASSNG